MANEQYDDNEARDASSESEYNEQQNQEHYETHIYEDDAEQEEYVNYDDAEYEESEIDKFAKDAAIVSVLQRNIDVRNDYGSLKRQLLISMLVNICLTLLVLAMVLAFSYYPKTKYIPTKDNSAICEVYPEDNPNLTDTAISEFAKDGILNLYTFDYINYEAQMNNVLDRFFTPQGRAATVQAVKEAGLVEYARNNALTFRASAINAVRIEQTSTDKAGRTYWIVRFPMVLDIYSGGLSPIDSQRHLVTVRVSADTASVSNPRGLGISSVTLEPLTK